MTPKLTSKGCQNRSQKAFQFQTDFVPRFAPLRPPPLGPFLRPSGSSWGPFRRPNQKERLRDAIITCSDKHLEEELRRTSLKLRNGPQVDPNLTAARLLKSPKRNQNQRKTHTFGNVALSSLRRKRHCQKFMFSLCFGYFSGF